jgi:hypothetical protein
MWPRHCALVVGYCFCQGTVGPLDVCHCANGQVLCEGWQSDMVGVWWPVPDVPHVVVATRAARSRPPALPQAPLPHHPLCALRHVVRCAGSTRCFPLGRLQGTYDVAFKARLVCVCPRGCQNVRLNPHGVMCVVVRMPRRYLILSPIAFLAFGLVRLVAPWGWPLLCVAGCCCPPPPPPAHGPLYCLQSATTTHPPPSFLPSFLPPPPSAQRWQRPMEVCLDATRTVHRCHRSLHVVPHLRAGGALRGRHLSWLSGLCPQAYMCMHPGHPKGYRGRADGSECPW